MSGSARKRRLVGLHGAVDRWPNISLRRIAVTNTFAAPLVLTLIAAVIPPGLLLIACVGLAAVSVSIGVLIERWLFFAEAKHVVILYYGAERA